MNQSLKVLAKESGFKITAMAKKIDMKPNYLAKCLRGERTIPEDKGKQLRTLLEAIPA